MDYYSPVRIITGEEDDKMKNDLDRTEFEIDAYGHNAGSSWTNKAALAQVLAVTAKNMLLLTLGCTNGFTVVLIPSLLADDDGLHLSKEQVSWFASSEKILSIVFSLMSGYVTSHFGRRRVMMGVCIPMIVSWILFHLARTTGIMYLCIIIQSASYGLCESAILTYMGEVCEPRFRGSLAASSPLFYQMGVISQLLLHHFMAWRTMAIVNIAFPVATFLAIYMVPESPIWLLTCGRMDEAESSLCWLRGWVPRHKVQQEFNVILKAQQVSSEFINQWSVLRQRTCWMPLFFIAMTAFLTTQTGYFTIRVYSVVIFQWLGSPFDAYTSATIFASGQLVGCMLCILTIHSTGKRPIAVLTTFASALLLALVAVYTRFRHQLTHQHIYTWLPLIALTGSNFFTHWGIHTLLTVLISEILPLEIRANGSAASLSFANLLFFASFKMFFASVELLGLWGLLSLYSAVSCLLCLFFFIYLPETEGRTVLQIRQHFAGSNNAHAR